MCFVTEISFVPQPEAWVPGGSSAPYPSQTGMPAPGSGGTDYHTACLNRIYTIYMIVYPLLFIPASVSLLHSYIYIYSTNNFALHVSSKVSLQFSPGERAWSEFFMF